MMMTMMIMIAKLNINNPKIEKEMSYKKILKKQIAGETKSQETEKEAGQNKCCKLY